MYGGFAAGLVLLLLCTVQYFSKQLYNSFFSVNHVFINFLTLVEIERTGICMLERVISRFSTEI